MRKLFLAQAIIILIAACVWGLFNGGAVPSVLYGGISCILPNLYFAYVFFSRKHTRRPRQILIAFYIGEFTKMIVCAVLILLAIKYLHALILPTVVGYFVANMVFWIAPTLVLKQQMKMRST